MRELYKDSLPASTKGGGFTIDLRPEWDVWGPNGGYVSAILLNAVAARSSCRLPVPASLYVQYLAVAEYAQAQIDVVCMKQGRTAEAHQATLTQGGKIIAQAMIWTTVARNGLSYTLVKPPMWFVPPEAGGPRPVTGTMRFWDNLDIRGVHVGDGAYSHWYRFHDQRLPSSAFEDALRSVVLTDTMPWPAAHFMLNGNPGYVAPSLDLYVRFHRSAEASEWLFCDARTETADSGLVAGRADIWDQNGALIASGACQSLCIPLPARE